MGDPSGVGPEVALKALASPRIKGLAKILLIGDRGVVDRLERKFGLRLDYPLMDLANVSRASFSYGRSTPAYGRASIEYLDAALKILGEGKADALVTAPVNKSSIKSEGLTRFEGHTEYLAEKTGTKDFAMLFVGGSMRIALVTRHIALMRVGQTLKSEKIFNTIRITHKYLGRYFKVRNPCIGVLGLNPHAGENGAFGMEERRIILPAIKRALSAGLGKITGPIPPDVIFSDCKTNRYDAVIAMYHDQGLIPFKMAHFRDGVNVTLGLPFVRTSPDHGTAFDIAGKGVADPSSMIEAIHLALKIC
jgi:4-hydroxythreonine-4-phosphate dehydrogenase